MNKGLLIIVTAFLTLGLSISTQNLLAAWQGPTASPPDGNVDAPLNAGSDTQTKNGALAVALSTTEDTGLTVYLGDLAVDNGGIIVSGSDPSFITESLGIGMTPVASLSQTLVVNGNTSLSGDLIVGGTLDTTLNCTSFANGGKVTTNAQGHLVCADDGGGGAIYTAGTGITISGTSISANCTQISGHACGSDLVNDGVYDLTSMRAAVAYDFHNLGGVDNVGAGCSWSGWAESATITLAEDVIQDDGNTECDLKLSMSLYCNGGVITSFMLNKKNTCN